MQMFNSVILCRSLVFRWTVIPWIQDETDRWVLMRNMTAPRKDKHKVLPHGIPEIIRKKPEQYGSLDFKVRLFFRKCLTLSEL
jgi:hypothetical protein